MSAWICAAGSLKLCVSSSAMFLKKERRSLSHNLQMGLEHLDDAQKHDVVAQQKKRKATHVSWPSVFGACQRNSTEMRKNFIFPFFFSELQKVCWTRRGAGNRPFVMSRSARVCDNANGGLTEVFIPFQTCVKYNTGSFPEIFLLLINNNARLLRRWPG